MTKQTYKGAKLANKRRILLFITLLFLSCGFVFWHESPIVRIHNFSPQSLTYSLSVEGNEYAAGKIPPNTIYNATLPIITGRKKAVFFKGKTKDKIITFTTKTPFLGGVDLYINPQLQISTEETPLGFITQKEEVK